MVCCILLNRTSRKQVDKIRQELFNRYPNIQDLAHADLIELEYLLQPLGLYHQRALSLKIFARQFCNDKQLDYQKLRGIGKYALDSYRLFVMKDLTIQPNDKVLIDSLAKFKAMESRGESWPPRYISDEYFTD